MEELHELAIRLPSGHIVRHAHARSVAKGVVSFEDAVALPELVTLLPSNSFGLRSVVRRGLSESHLHMKGVISAEETWADNLLRPLSARAIQGRTAQERRLLVLNLFAGRILAIAVWLSLAQIDNLDDLQARGLDADPRRLLNLLDRIYFARTAHEEYWATVALWQAINKIVYGRRPEITGPAALVVPDEYRFLLRWMAPTGFYLQSLNLVPGDGPLPGGSPEGPQERIRLVHQLHLAAHVRLFQLTRGESPEDDENTITEPEHQTQQQRHFLHEALFRYLVCRTHHWQLATQQGRTTGLRNF